MNDQEIFKSKISQYRKIKKLGVGSYGQATLIENKTSKQKYVLKTVNMSNMDENQRKNALNEVQFLHKMKHEYIIGMKDCFICNAQLCILMEYAEAGDLYKVISNRRKLKPIIGIRGAGFSEKQVIRWLIQLLLALGHLHSLNVLHRDIKSQNIFLMSDGTAKMGDFGISKALDQTDAYANTMIGTPYYLAPEICMREPYSKSADIWALGCMLFEICALRVPFDAQDINSLYRRIVEGLPPVFPLHYSCNLRKIYEMMLTKDPRLRPSAWDLLRTDFLRSELENIKKNSFNLYPPILFSSNADKMTSPQCTGNSNNINLINPYKKKNSEYLHIRTIINFIIKTVSCR